MDWKTWDTNDWSYALLRHFFGVGIAGSLRPVARLVVVPEELAAAASVARNDAEAVRDGFLRALQCSPREFRRRLSAEALLPSAWDRDEAPPFLAYLFFTCFAAGTLESETITEGDFRERMRILLGHPPRTAYPLEHLSLLWETFASWLKERRRAGTPYRVLELPDRGWMKRIGYSVRLAFPTRRDGVVLRKVLSAAELPDVATVWEVMLVLGRARLQFSAEFQRVLDAAQSSCRRNEDGVELQALWSAVLEVRASLKAAVPLRPARLRYQLVLQEDEASQPHLVLLATDRPAKHDGPLFAKLDEPIGEYRYLVRGANGSSKVIARLLLMGELAAHIPGLKASPVALAVQQGVLLFQQTTFATWELVSTRPSEGPAKGIVAVQMIAGFAQLFPKQSALATKPIFVDGWLLAQGFDAADLAVPSDQIAPDLQDVRCLQVHDVGSQLRLAGGVRVEGGFLGIQGLLPSVRCAGAECVSLCPESGGEDGGRRLDLAWDKPKEAFSFSDVTQDIEGTYTIEARRGGEVLASRSVAFFSRVLGWAYTEPSQPQYLLAEAAEKDVLPWPDAKDAFASAAMPSGVLGALATMRGAASHPDDGFLAPPPTPEHNRFIEGLAGLAARRQGVSESDLIDLFSSTTRTPADFRVWDHLRSWQEVGFFDSLTRRHWRGRFFLAREPRLVLIANPNSQGRVALCLFGLAPLRLREQAQRLLEGIGASPRTCLALSSSAPPPPMWWVDRDLDVAPIAKELSLKPVQTCRRPDDLLAPLADIVCLTEHEPAGYDLAGTWDWERGGFRTEAAQSESRGVAVRWYARDDAPDQYLVVRGDEQIRASLSRNWALLLGFSWAGRSAFRATGTDEIWRGGESGPFLPLPVARAQYLYTAVVPGVFGRGTEHRGYGYGALGSDQQRLLLSWINGVAQDPLLGRRLSWLLEVIREQHQSDDDVPLPRDIANKLEALTGGKRTGARAWRKVPRALLPQIRHVISLMGGSQ